MYIMRKTWTRAWWGKGSQGWLSSQVTGKRLVTGRKKKSQRGRLFSELSKKDEVGWEHWGDVGQPHKSTFRRLENSRDWGKNKVQVGKVETKVSITRSSFKPSDRFPSRKERVATTPEITSFPPSWPPPSQIGHLWEGRSLVRKAASEIVIYWSSSSLLKVPAVWTWRTGEEGEGQARREISPLTPTKRSRKAQQAGKQRSCSVPSSRAVNSHSALRQGQVFNLFVPRFPHL